MLRAVPDQPDHQPPDLTEETTMPNPADAYLHAMHDQASQRLGHAISVAIRAIFDADGFPNGARAAIARQLRAVPDDTDLADGITQAITAVYAEHGFPHDPDSVRRAVARHLREGHGTLPPDARP
jgi:hypothetical protein